MLRSSASFPSKKVVMGFHLPGRVERPLIGALCVACAHLAASVALAAPPPDFPDSENVPAVDARVVVSSFGEFRVGFYRDSTPNHVAHFLTLAATGYFDGMSFHRVIPGLLVQTGDPASRDEDWENDGWGGPDYLIPAESGARARPHRRGSVSMAWRGNTPGTAGSQWFVVLGDDIVGLDQHGTVIGEVVEGMDTIDKIAQVTTRRNWNPLHRVVIESVTLVAPLDDATRPTAGAESDLAPDSLAEQSLLAEETNASN